MIKNTCSSSFPEEYDFSSLADNNWENFLRFNPDDIPNNPGSPAMVSEIVFEKQRFENSEMEEEFTSFQPDAVLFDSEIPTKLEEINFDELMNFGINHSPRYHQNEEEPSPDNERSSCSRCHTDDLEELGSISTKDSFYGDLTNYEGNEYHNWEENSEVDSRFEADNELKDRIFNFAQTRSDDEKAYIQKVYPLLLVSLKKIRDESPIQLPITDDLIFTMLKELLYGKELLIGAERQTIQTIVEKEINGFKVGRPSEMVNDDELMIQKRKEKKSEKGNRNSSTLNHMNENYVSNIFQFTKRNYPEDKEIQKIGNERNVSAANFRRMMRPQLSDDLWKRKAKARIVGNGKEFLENIEYWMRDGYFAQCSEREKYILQKEKALRDLALTGHY